MAAVLYNGRQCISVSHWKSSTEPVLTDGTVAIWTPADRETGTPAAIQVNGGANVSLDHYAVTGTEICPGTRLRELKPMLLLQQSHAVVKNGETACWRLWLRNESEILQRDCCKCNCKYKWFEKSY